MPIRSARPLFVAGLVVASAVTPVALFAGSDAGAPAAAAATQCVPAPRTPSPSAVRVLDWNIHGGGSNYLGTRWSLLEKAICDYDPDVVALQEVNRAAGTTVSHDGTTSPGIDEVAELTKDFPWFADTGTEVHQVWSRSDRGGAPGRSAGNLLLSRYALTQPQADTLPNDPADDIACSPAQDYDGRRTQTGCPVNRSYAGATANIGGTGVHVFTAHFSSDLTDTARRERASQIQFMADRLQAASATSPSLFTGDLNAPPFEANRFKLPAVGLNDAWTLARANSGSAVATHQGEDGTYSEIGRIDYVWASPGLDVTAMSLADAPVDPSGDPVSDHRLVMTTVAVHSPVFTRAAGASGTSSGWATAAVSPTAAGVLRVCDNVDDPYGVFGYLLDADTGTVIAGTRDDRYADACVSATVPAVPAATRLSVRVCRNNDGAPADCVTRPV